ncbi:MAG: nucleoside deaminase [Pricia sp.]
MKPISNNAEKDKAILEECLILAKEAVEAGDEPFGSVLVNPVGDIIAKARNRVNERNLLAHPEIELAEWSLENLTGEERGQATMYTSGEHCPMCAAAHGWAGIGGLVYLSSAEQLQQWLKEFDAPEAPIHFVPVGNILKTTSIRFSGDTEQIAEIKALHGQYLYRKRKKSKS